VTAPDKEEVRSIVAVLDTDAMYLLRREDLSVPKQFVVAGVEDDKILALPGDEILPS